MAGIFLIQNGKLIELAESAFGTEDVFQELLSEYPNLIAGDQINSDEPRRWLLIRREIGIPREDDGGDHWSLDHLFLDQDGVPTLVEVKRGTDTRLRREVVGQMLDYAANAVAYWPVETIQSQFGSRCEGEGADPEEVLKEFLDEDTEPGAFWADVKTNLQAGKVRLLFVADVIPNELRRIIEFLNEQMSPAEILALEIKRYEGGGQQTLVPRVIGQTAAAQRQKGPAHRPTRKWDEASFLAAVDAEQDEELKRHLTAVYDWAKGAAVISWGRGATKGSFQASLDGVSNFLYLESDGYLSFCPPRLKRLRPFDDPELLRELTRRLEKVGGMEIDTDSWSKHWVVTRLQQLNGDAGLDELLSVLRWTVEQMRAHSGSS